MNRIKETIIEEYWLRKLSGGLPKITSSLPYGIRKAKTGARERRAFTLGIPTAAAAKLEKTARHSDIALFILLLSGLNIVLKKYTGVNDLVVGTVPPASNGGGEHILFCRNRTDEQSTVKGFITEVRQEVLETFNHVDYSLEAIAQQLSLHHRQKDHDKDSPGLFQVALLYEPFQRRNQYLDKFDLLVVFSRNGQQLELRFEYPFDFLPGEMVRMFGRNLVTALERMMDDPTLKLPGLDIVNAEEKKRLVYDSNRTGADYPKHKTLHRLFEEQAEKTGDRIAVISRAQGGYSCALTHRELNEKSSRLARVLKTKGVGKNAIVGIMTHRSIDSVIGLMAILKAGAAFLPIDPDDPEPRKQWIIQDSGLSILLTQEELKEKSSSLLPFIPSGNILTVDDETLYSPYPSNPLPLETGNDPRDAAYIIYTSGSTGKPKGVLVEHRSVVNYIWWAIKQYVKHEKGNLRFPLFTSLSFDLTVTSIFVPLLSGHTIVVYEGESKESLTEKIIEENQVDVVKLTPSHLKLLLAQKENQLLTVGADRPSNIKRFILGGEALETKLAGGIVEAFNGKPVIYNEYGPTETAVGCMIHAFSPGTDTLPSVPIGAAADNVHIYLLDKRKKPVPFGAVGEIYISGDGVARGYLNRPVLTAERFFEDPFVPGKRMYQTGDLARCLPDGGIEFLGRIDQQVKIRGFRIELGEIESKLMQYRKHKPIPVIKNDPKTSALNNVRRCSRCLLPTSYPGIHFDNQGVCSVCREYDTYKGNIGSYFKKEEDFHQLIEKIKKGSRGKSEYDCLLLFSGGKDSTYVLYRLIDMGLNVLTFTFDNGYISDAAFANINRTTANLGVENIVYTAEHMNRVFAESLHQHHNVCHGCWNALNTLGAKVAHDKGINLVISGLSRGQIFEMRLEGLFQRRIFDENEIEENLLLFRKNFHSKNNKFLKILDIELAEEVVGQLHFVDFFRYFDTPVTDIRKYLKEKGWIQPADTGFCSSNCVINDVGIYMHLQEEGYHFYTPQLSWDCRLGTITREQGLKEVTFEGNVHQVDTILREIGYYRSPIQNAAVIDREDQRDDKYLCAYIVSEGELTASELRGHLAAELPDYMIPTHFVPLEEIPLTPSGKLDRKALPAPQLKAGKEHIPPRDDKEKKLAKIWADVLGVEKDIIGINANFFQLGGNSLKATFLATKIHKELNINIPLTKVFKRPTLKGLAQEIDVVTEEEYLSIPAAEKKMFYPLSSQQKRLFVLQQFDRESTGYNIPMVLRLEGKLAKERFELTFKRLIARHESLRTSFDMADGEPVQRIHDEAGFEIEYYDLAVKDLIHQFIQPFDLTRAPLIRVGLIKETDSRHILLVDMHHIITDGISQHLLTGEFISLYTGEEFPPLKLHYKDYAEWQNSQMQKEAAKKQEGYWLNRFEGDIPVLELPTDYARPPIQSFEGGMVHFTLDDTVLKRLKQAAADRSTTLYTVLLTAYNIFLSKISGQEDIIVGTDVGGRTHGDLEPVIGMFVNTLALRNYPGGEKTFNRFHEEVNETTLAALENQAYHFEDLVNRVSVNRDASRNPLFDVMFSFLNVEAGRGTIHTPGNTEIVVSPYFHENSTAKFDLTLNGIESSDGVSFSFEYCTKLFKKSTVQRFVPHFKQVVSAFIDDPQCRLSAIGIISEAEKKQVLLEFNNTQRPVVKGKNYTRLFQESAVRNQDKTAVVFDGHHMTYKELNDTADRIASRLEKLGAGAGTMVALHLERSIAMLASIIGIFKAGAAYVPTETDSPLERIAFMLEDSHSGMVITDDFKTETINRLRDRSEKLKNIHCVTVHHKERTGFPGRGVPPGNPQLGSDPHQLAYMIYTSGTTGKPKGVPIHQLGMINHLYAKINDLSITGKDIIAQTASACFDISVWQFLAGLLVGGRTVVIAKEFVLEPRQFLAVLQQTGVTILESVPSLMTAFLETAAHEQNKTLQLRRMVPTGEALTVPLVREWFRHYPGIPLVNAYGPTEASDDVTHYTVPGIPAGDQRAIPIGKPLQNLHIYILDKHLSLCPIGIRGEICVAGIGVGKGYWNNVEKTAEAFIPNPFSDHIDNPNYARLYRTGDIGFFREDGNIECLGRLDHQVKIRGNRIELEEIERHLVNHNSIKEAVVIAREHGKGDKYLCAYLVGEGDAGTYSTAELRAFLSAALPDYMIPAYFVPMEEIPLTPNGKVDRKALPEPDTESDSETRAAPRSKVEEILVQVWQEVLGVKQVGILDNFFEIGGDSIKAIQLAARLKKHRLELKVNDLFLHPSITELAGWVKPMVRIAHQGAVEGGVPLSPIQKWFFENDFSAPHHYNLSVMLYREEGFNEAYVEKIFEKLVEHHDALRMVFEKEGDKIIQRNRGVEGTLFELNIFRPGDEENTGDALKAEIKRHADRIQGGIDLSTGPLVKCGLFKTASGDHLLIAIHHLVMDGISWRILLEDFYIGYQQLVQGEDIRFQEKTDSFMHWVQVLTGYAAVVWDDREELEYWQRIENTPVEPLRRDYEIETAERKHKNMKSVRFDLNEIETEKLLKEVNWAYNTEINDILLTALGLAAAQWSGTRKIAITLEGHGREPVIQDVDVSRTVGWFTVEYPVLLDMEKSYHLSNAVKYVKESLRNIPGNGIGYGILRYLKPPAKKETMVFQFQPEISFNYLGQFAPRDNISGMNMGESISPEMKNLYAIDVNGMIAGGQLNMSFAYNSYEYKESTIRELTDLYKTNLLKIIDHCTKKESKEFTPGDFDYSNMEIEELDELKEELSGIV